MTTEFLNEFGSERGGPVRLSDVLARGVPIRWDEAVALLQEIIDTVTAVGGEGAPIPAFEDVLLEESGTIRVNTARRGEQGPVAAGRALHALLATADVPLPLRLFVTQANVPETHKSLKAFGDALAYFGKPGRGDLIRAIFERHRSNAPSMPGPTPGAIPPLPHNAARGDEFPEPRRRARREWLMPAAVGICVVSLGAVIWFGLFGGSTSGTSAPAQGNVEAAEQTPAAKNATTSPADAKRLATKATVAEHAPAPTNTSRSQATSAKSAAVAGLDSSALADASTAEPLLRFPPMPVIPAAETTKAAVLPSSREYVVAPHENATTTIYSPEDTDVQPPVMIYPSLPPPIFVARNADAVVVNRMELVIAADGTVERVRLINGPWRMPDMMLLSGAKLWKFSPAVKDGTPVRYRTTVTWTGFP